MASTSGQTIPRRAALLSGGQQPRGISKRRRRRRRGASFPLTLASTGMLPGAMMSTVTGSPDSASGVGATKLAGLIHVTNASFEPLNRLRSTLVSSMPLTSPVSLYCHSVHWS